MEADIGEVQGVTTGTNPMKKIHIEVEVRDEAENSADILWDYYLTDLSGDCP